MSPQLIVVGSILQPAQVSFTQDDHVIDALAPDRADQPFSKPILPGRGSRNRLVTNPHGAQPAFEDHALDTVAIADLRSRAKLPLSPIKQVELRSR